MGNDQSSQQSKDAWRRIFATDELRALDYLLEPHRRTSEPTLRAVVRLVQIAQAHFPADDAAAAGQEKQLKQRDFDSLRLQLHKLLRDSTPANSQEFRETLTRAAADCSDEQWAELVRGLDECIARS